MLYERFGGQLLHGCVIPLCSGVGEIHRCQILQIDLTSVSARQPRQWFPKQESNRFRDALHLDQEFVLRGKRTTRWLSRLLCTVSRGVIQRFHLLDVFHQGERRRVFFSKVSSVVLILSLIHISQPTRRTPICVGGLGV